MRTVVATALALLTSSAVHATETRQSYSATAFALDGGDMLYVEKHVETWRDGRLAERRVSYEDPAGEPIAEKLVSYGSDVEAPSFEMIDFRVGLREGARVEENEIMLYSGPSAESERGRTMKRPQAAVVDAGFDAFMQDNFGTVRSGDSLDFDFAVPALRRFFRFELLPQGEVAYGGEQALLIKMRPAAAILRWLVDPIELVYSPEGKLLEFRGLANVLDEEGDRYEARIVFDYPSDAPTAAQLGAAQ